MNCNAGTKPNGTCNETNVDKFYSALSFPALTVLPVDVFIFLLCVKCWTLNAHVIIGLLEFRKSRSETLEGGSQWGGGLRLSAQILALLRLSVNFFQLRLTKKLIICFVSKG